MKPAAGKFLIDTIRMIAAAARLLSPLLVALISASPVRGAAPPATGPQPSQSGATAERPGYELLAHGNHHALWIAEVMPNDDPLRPGMRTRFRFRTAGDGANWRPLGEVAARVVALSDRGGELLILLEKRTKAREWMMVSESGARTGVSLPGQGDIVAIAGDANNVWAIGEDLRPPPSPSASTSPATGPAAAPTPTAATTTPAATGPAARTVTTSSSSTSATLGLFRLERGDWVYQSDMPPAIRPNDIAAMTLVDQRPLLAVINPRDQQLRLYSFGPSGWSDPAPITTLPPEPEVQLLNLGGRPIVAITDRVTGSSTVHLGGANWSGPIKLQPSPEAESAKDRAVAAGLGQIRLLASSAPGKLIEQPYRENDGTLAGSATQSVQQPTFSMDRVAFALEVLAMGVLLVVMLGTLRRRGAIQQAARHLDQLHVAPLSYRFAAGVIDAVPLFVAAVLASPESPTPAAARSLTAMQLTWAAAGLAVYLLHTTAGELFAGRSIGKVLFGLRVVALDGNRASAGAILIRNAVRIVDLILTFPLMIMVLLMIFLPLHQRLGDLAAGTLVVRDQPPEPEEADESGGDSSSSS